ncbi:HipA domain-containing protein [Collinsella intestinalis]|uniref:HipA domain-containing protein n=1 Tax=Collinsella intestinalis TaxID=147207 RepID=UPI003F579C4C
MFKNGVIGFRLQALNEYACMKIAERDGIAAAKVDYRFFEDEPALIVKRYDRIYMEDGTVARVHQEDCCQALGYMPYQKYASDGARRMRAHRSLRAHRPGNFQRDNPHAHAVFQLPDGRNGRACPKLLRHAGRRRIGAHRPPCTTLPRGWHTTLSVAGGAWR